MIKRIPMKLRPHHVLDILRNYGNGIAFKAHPYGHAVDSVAHIILSNLDIEIEFILGADDMCQPCQHLQADGRCDDVLHQLENPISKHTYNDELDTRLFLYLDMTLGIVMPLRTFLERVGSKIPGIEQVCTHPKEDEQFRLHGITQGLKKLGIHE